MSHVLFPISCNQRGVEPVVGSFAPDTANPPTDLKGAGFTVVRTSQGLFTVTFDQVFPDFVAFDAHLQHVTAAARYAQVGIYTAASKTLQIRVVDGSGNVQDVAADAASRVNFVAWVRSSSA